MAPRSGWRDVIGSLGRAVSPRPGAQLVSRLALFAVVALLATPLAAEGQQPKSIPRLCFMTFDPDSSRSTRFGAFFDGLRDLGYVDGQTIAIDYLSANGQGEQFPAIAAE